MKSKEFSVKRNILVRIDKGDEIITSLEHACLEHKIRSGIVWGIGAISSCTLITGVSTEKVNLHGLKHVASDNIVLGEGSLSSKRGALSLGLIPKLPRTCEGPVKPIQKDYFGPIEISCAIGNISLKQRNPFVHLHGAFSLSDGSTIGGHLVKGIISLTGEFFIFETSEFKREFNKKIKMFTIKV